jgi:predicted O-methyltransferase YrrM
MKRLPLVLEEMLSSGASVNRSGETVPVDSQITRRHAHALMRTTRQRRPRLCIETGMAFGYSTLAMLGGTDGSVISIDPYQVGREYYDEVGVAAVERAGFGDRHRLLAEPSHVGLPRLLAEGIRAQFAYIDGWHTFDYALVDFFYIDKMLDTGGVVAFNDCDWDAVLRVIRFVQTHRSYREIEVGLPKTYSRGPSRWAAVRKRLIGRSSRDRCFEKVSAAEPSWDFYKSF